MFDLDNPSRQKSVKVLAIGNYAVMFLDIIQGLGFVPMYLHYLGEQLYGLWLGTGGIVTILAFLDMGIATVVIQRVSSEYSKKRLDGIGSYFFSGLFVNTIFMSLLLISGFILGDSLEVFFDRMSREDAKLLVPAFKIAIVALALTLMNNLVEGCLNALQKPLFGKITQFIAASLGLITTFCILIYKETVLALPAGIMVRALFSLLPNVFYLSLLFNRNHIKIFSLRWPIIKEYLIITPNLFLAKIGTSLTGNIEPTLLNIYLTPEIAVYYSVSKKAGDLVKMFLDRIGGILLPSMSHLYSENNLQEFTQFCLRILKILLPIMFAVFSVYILLNKPFVELWLGTENYLGNRITIMLAFALSLVFLSNTLSYLLSTTGDIKLPSNIVFLESCLKLILMIISLKYYGIYGLPVSLIVSSIFFSTIYLARWDHHLEINLGQKISMIRTLMENLLAFSIVTIILLIIQDEFEVDGFLSLAFLGTLYASIMLALVYVLNKPIRYYFTKRTLYFWKNEKR
jgi:O-antigen/teichoic acid export membrane protein